MDSSITSTQSHVSSGGFPAKKRRRIEGSDEERLLEDGEVDGVGGPSTNHRANTIENEEAGKRVELEDDIESSHTGKGKTRSKMDLNRSSRYFQNSLPQAPSSPIARPSTSIIPTITDHTANTGLAAYRSAQKAKETELLATREREQADQVKKEEEEKEKVQMKGELKLAKGEIAFKNSVSGDRQLMLHQVIADEWLAKQQTIIAQNGTIEAVKQAVTCNVCLEMFVNPHV